MEDAARSVEFTYEEGIDLPSVATQRAMNLLRTRSSPPQKEQTPLCDHLFGRGTAPRGRGSLQRVALYDRNLWPVLLSEPCEAWQNSSEIGSFLTWLS